MQIKQCGQSEPEALKLESSVWGVLSMPNVYKSEKQTVYTHLAFLEKFFP